MQRMPVHWDGVNSTQDTGKFFCFRCGQRTCRSMARKSVQRRRSKRRRTRPRRSRLRSSFRSVQAPSEALSSEPVEGILDALREVKFQPTKIVDAANLKHYINVEGSTLLVMKPESLKHVHLYRYGSGTVYGLFLSFPKMHDGHKSRATARLDEKTGSLWSDYHKTPTVQSYLVHVNDEEKSARIVTMHGKVTDDHHRWRETDDDIIHFLTQHFQAQLISRDGPLRARDDTGEFSSPKKRLLNDSTFSLWSHTLDKGWIFHKEGTISRKPEEPRLKARLKKSALTWTACDRLPKRTRT